MTLYKFKTRTGWMRSLESAFVTITSPSGKTLSFNKWSKFDDLRSKSDWQLLNQIHDCDNGIIELTVDQARQLKVMYDRENVPRKTGYDRYGCPTSY